MRYKDFCDYKGLRGMRRMGCCRSKGMKTLAIFLMAVFMLSALVFAPGEALAKGFIKARAKVEKQANFSWTGTWSTDLGTLNMVQTGNTVTGVLDNGNGQFVGTVVGNNLKCKWTVLPVQYNVSGSTEFMLQMSRDGKKIESRWMGANGLKLGILKNWGGKLKNKNTPSARVDLKTLFNGTWNTTWGEMKLTRDGSKVTGTFTKDQGRIVGNVVGWVLIGTWTKAPTYAPSQDAGDVILIAYNQGLNFAGKWRYGSKGQWYFDLKGTRTDAQSSTAVSTPWTGTWNSPWGEMKLIQDGSKVTGSYTHSQGKITGTVNGRTFTGTWSEAPSYAPPYEAGDLVMTMSGNQNTLNGKWRYGSSGDWMTNWKATRAGTTTSTSSSTQTSTSTISETAPWTGKWITARGTMTLTQSGDRVTGTYNGGQGVITGVVNGSVLSGTWSEAPRWAAPDNAGNFEFTMSSDKLRFTGRYQKGFSGDWITGWDGLRE